MKNIVMRTVGREKGAIILKSRKTVLEEMLEDVADFSNEDQKTLKLYVLPYVSLFKALLMNGLDAAVSTKITKEYFFKNVKLLSRFLRTSELFPGFFRGFRRRMEKGLFSGGEDVIEVLQNNQEGLVFNMKKCLWFEYCSRINHRELCKIFCDADYETYGKMKTVEFVRSKTLADGDPVCDFHLYNMKQQY